MFPKRKACLPFPDQNQRFLQAFKVKAVTAYMERLLKLASNASLRAEMTQFALSRTAEQPVLAEHRAGELSPSNDESFRFLWYEDLKSNVTS